MLLATFQPTQETLDQIIKENGYEKQPYWCISAETYQDFMMGIATAFPVYPEILYVFEAENPIAIDSNAWHQHLEHVTDQNVDVSDFQTDRTDILREYLVDEIPEKAYKLDLANIQERDLTSDNELLDEFLETLNRILKNGYKQILDLREDSNTIIKNGEPVEAKPGSLENKAARANITLMAFAGTYSPVIYNEILEKFTGKSWYKLQLANEPNQYWELANASTKLTLLQRVNPVDFMSTMTEALENGVDFNTLTTIANRSFSTNPIAMYDAMAETKTKRNENCPCGSGLKAKKCHLSTTKIQLR